MPASDLNMTMPDISLVTPSYNQGRFIEQTILSVLSQEGLRCQYIVVDACSTDNTAEVLEQYQDRIDIVISEPDDGQADALVKGFAFAEAPIVGYLNSDDYLMPGALQRVLNEFARRPDTEALYSHRIYVDESDKFLRYWHLPPHSNYVNLRWDFIPQETCFWRRSAMEAVGGIDGNLQFAMDYDLFVRMMRSGCRFQRIDDFFSVFREHEQSKTVRHMHTIGTQEVQLIQKRNDISVSRFDLFVAASYHRWMLARSARLKRRLPEGPEVFRQRARTD